MKGKRNRKKKEKETREMERNANELASNTKKKYSKITHTAKGN